MTAPFTAAVDDCFRHLGRDAVYTADGGEPVTVRVIAKRPDEIVGLGETRIHAGTTLFDVRVSEVAEPRPGDRLVIDGETYLVQGEPVQRYRAADLDIGGLPGMKLTATIVGSLAAEMQAEMRHIAKSVPDGVKAAGDGLKGSLRKQVVAAGLGARLSRTWRGKTYVNKGHNAASLVWSKAPRIIRAFDEGVTIRSKDGFWLAIPTAAAPKSGIGGKRINPSNFPTEHRFGPLRFVYRRGKSSLLVVDGVRVSAQTGRVGRQAKGGGRTKSGRYKQGIATVVMFVLVRQVKLRKRLNVARAVEAWARRLPVLIRRQVQTTPRR